jgi:hypothetical protein
MELFVELELGARSGKEGLTMPTLPMLCAMLSASFCCIDKKLQ